MAVQIRKRAKGIAWLLTLVYFASYLTRKNFNVMISAVANSMVPSVFPTLDEANTSLAVISVALTIVYGAGQIINGILGDKIKPQLMLTAGLSLAAASNIAMAFCPDNHIVMAIIWGINGFAHSMLWPPIVRLMATYLNSDEYGYAAVRVSWGSSIASIVLYFGCGALISVMEWRPVLLICAGGCIAILAAWTLFNGKLLRDPLVKLDTSDTVEEKKKFSLPSFVFIPISLIMLGIILQGSLRDGVETWTPTILQGENEALGGSVAIILTVVPSIFSMISFSVFDLLHRKIFKNEVTCAAVIFLGATVAALVVYLTNLFVTNAALETALYLTFISLLTGCMHGINLMLITVVPKRFLKSGKVSTFSGILNACTYIGSAIGVWLFAQISTGGDWRTSMLAWIIISAAGVASCILAVPLWKKFRREYADN